MDGWQVGDGFETLTGYTREETLGQTGLANLQGKMTDQNVTNDIRFHCEAVTSQCLIFSFKTPRVEERYMWYAVGERGCMGERDGIEAKPHRNPRLVSGSPGSCLVLSCLVGAIEPPVKLFILKFHIFRLATTSRLV